MANGWTPERKAKQSELIHNWKPWQHSTGAKTVEGKAIVAKNAVKNGLWSILKELKKLEKLNGLKF